MGACYSLQNNYVKATADLHRKLAARNISQKRERYKSPPDIVTFDLGTEGSRAEVVYHEF